MSAREMVTSKLQGSAIYYSPSISIFEACYHPLLLGWPDVQLAKQKIHKVGLGNIYYDAVQSRLRCVVQIFQVTFCKSM